MAGNTVAMRRRKTEICRFMLSILWFGEVCSLFCFFDHFKESADLLLVDRLTDIESFYLIFVLEEETTPKIRELLQKDISYLDEIQTTSASSREFVLVLRMEEQDVYKRQHQSWPPCCPLSEAGLTYRRVH